MKKRITNWGNYPEITAEEAAFSTSRQLSLLLESHHSVIARGSGRCYGDASLGRNIISSLKYDKIIAFDRQEGIFECQAGITLDQILKIIVPEGWFIPVSPGTKFISIGGAVASNVHGKNHHIDGNFSNHILDLDVMLANGQLVKCSAFHQPDLFNATCGGMGLTGIITRVRFRLKKISNAYIRQKQIKAGNLEAIMQLFDEYKNYTYSMAWIDCLKSGKGFGRSILIMGENATNDELSIIQKKQPFILPKKKKLSIPFNLPSFILNQYSIRTFNYLYYHKNTKREISNTIAYEPFFYPLDKLLHWNRGYGKNGFVQYQFVLPIANSKRGLVEILNRINKKGMGSFLAVLKLFGKQDSLISFPMEGYTLAMDFPIRNGLFEFLDELDKMVLDYGGRLYLTKDARMKPEIFWNSYPHASDFAAAIRKYNPEYKFQSLQSGRLLLTKDYQ